MKKYVIFSFVILGLLAASWSYVVSPLFNKKTETCLITGKESVTKPENTGSQYRVYTTCGTYIVEDSIFLLRFDSADFYGKLAANKEYKIQSGGLRVPFLSIFPNIIKTEVIEVSEGHLNGF